MPKRHGPVMLSTVHDIVAKAIEDDGTRCIDDYVDVLLKAGPNSASTVKLASAVSYFHKNNLDLLLSAKGGGFVVAPRDI